MNSIAIGFATARSSLRSVVIVAAAQHDRVVPVIGREAIGSRRNRGSPELIGRDIFNGGSGIERRAAIHP